MTAVAKMQNGLIKDPAFLQDIRLFEAGLMHALVPVALMFESTRDVDRAHWIGGCETCYMNWRALT